MTFICTEFERIQRENKLLNDNLTATQARCTALLEEARRLRAKAAAGERLRHVVADNMTDASQAWAEPAVAEFDAAVGVE